MAGYTLLETRSNWKNNQHGRRAGSSTDHVLVKIWDKILRELDIPTSKAAVVCLFVCFVIGCPQFALWQLSLNEAKKPAVVTRLD